MDKGAEIATMEKIKQTYDKLEEVAGMEDSL